jgi:hypothetical protein
MSQVRLLGWKRLTRNIRSPGRSGVTTVIEDGFLLRVELVPNWFFRRLGFCSRFVEFFGDMDLWRDRQTHSFAGFSLSQQLYGIRQDLMYQSDIFRELLIK